MSLKDITNLSSKHESRHKAEAITKIKKEETSMLSINLPISLRQKFKKKCIDDRLSMTDSLIIMIQKYVSK